MPKPLIYLCGPIQGRTFANATTWRDQATELLAPEFGVLSPLRDKYDPRLPVGRENNAPGTYDAKTTAETYTDAEIVTRDLLDIDLSRAVLRFHDRSGEGSPMEAFYASHVRRMPVVVVNGSPQSERSSLSPWLRHHSVKILDSVEAACAYLKSFWLYPGEEVEQPWSNRELSGSLEELVRRPVYQNPRLILRNGETQSPRSVGGT